MRYNHITIAGRLVRDPEIKYTPAGKPICKMRIAVDQGTKDAKTTGYFDATCFDKLADTAGKYLKKGAGVLLGGRLEYREWESDQGGKRSAVEIIAHEVQFTDPPSRQEAGGPPANAGAEW
jgi:single-strand DNA-binding protein